MGNGNTIRKEKPQKQNKKNNAEPQKKVLEFKEDGQEYAQVTRMLGNGRVECKCFDGIQRLCKIRGALKYKKVWIKLGDIVLLGLRDFQDTKADVIHKYNPDEVHNLKIYGELPQSAPNLGKVTFVGNDFDEDIEFIDETDSSEDSLEEEESDGDVDAQKC